MAVSVKIPTPLRRLTEQQSTVSADGGDVAAMIESLDGSFPGIKARLCDEDGELRHFVNIYVNGEDIRYMDGTATALSFRRLPEPAGACARTPCVIETIVPLRSPSPADSAALSRQGAFAKPVDPPSDPTSSPAYPCDLASLARVPFRSERGQSFHPNRLLFGGFSSRERG